MQAVSSRKVESGVSRSGGESVGGWSGSRAEVGGAARRCLQVVLLSRGEMPIHGFGNG